MSEVLRVADLNAIETRVGAWLAQCPQLLSVFEPYTDVRGTFFPNGKDPYLAFAGAGLYGLPYDKLHNDYQGYNGKEAKLEAKRRRQIAKVPVLAAIYRMSGGVWGHSKKGYKDHGDDCNAEETYTSQQNGKIKKVGKKYCICALVYDKIKTGLWGYADGMGIEMTQEQANEAVRVFRQTYKEICECWYAIERAILEVMDGVETVRCIGPGDCVKFDKINITGRHPVLRMQLPSGRYLHYLDAHVEDTRMPWTTFNEQTGEEEEVYRPSLIYSGINQETKQWENWVQTHGGKVFENAVQGIARDILVAKLLKIDAAGGFLVGHVHDEGICWCHKNSPLTYQRMVEIMSEPEPWAPGLLLGASGFEDTFYHK